MKRRIVQHGNSSLTVTLPARWVQKLGLKKGDEIDVEESGSAVIVSAKKDQSAAKKVFSTKDAGIFTKNNLSHLYQLGYDEIEVIYDDAKTLDDIRDRISECIGFEMIDQKDNKVYIKSIATTLDSEFDTLLRKSFQITNEMAKMILDALVAGDNSKLHEIRAMERLNNRFTDVCIRILNKRGYKVQNRTMQMYEIVKNIERIADEFRNICDLLSDKKEKLDKTAILCYKEAVDYYLAFYNMFYKFDPELKRKLYEKRPLLLDKYAKLLEKTKGKDSVLMSYLMNIINRTYEGAGGYFALVL